MREVESTRESDKQALHEPAQIIHRAGLMSVSSRHGHHRGWIIWQVQGWI
jgi:hypothetical protein